MKRQAALIATALATAWSLGCVDISGPVIDGSWEPWTFGAGWDSVEWRGHIATGDRIEIKGIFGDIHAVPTAGDEVVVTAIKNGPAGKVDLVRIEVVPHEDGVTICALHPDAPGSEPNVCAPGLAGNNTVKDSAPGAVRVTFTVQVPEGVDLVGRTIVGHLGATDLRSDAFLHGIWGDITVSTTRLATASTVSGSVTASIGRTDWGRDLAFTSVSGNVSVAVPSGTNAEVVANTMSGSVTSDFPLRRTGTGMHGTIGSGGPVLSLSSMAGHVRLLRGQ